MARPHPALLELAAGRPLPTTPTDVEWLMRSALEHHMNGLLWTRARAGELDAGSQWREALAGLDVVTRARHRRIWEVLASIRTRLNGLGIEFAVLKGVPAEARWYDRVGERPCRDLDLLLSPAHLHRVGEVLDDLHPGHPLRDSYQAMFDRGIACSLDLEVEGVAVDLHVELFKLGPPCRDPERLWAHTVPYPLADGTEVLVLDAELSLVHFLVHLSKDSFCWLLGFADVARILERETLDWDGIERLVADAGLDAPVWGGVSAVADTLGLRTPRPPSRDWRGRLWSLIWRPSVRLGGDAGWVRHRHRPLWLPFVTDVGIAPALRWEWAQVTLTPALARQANPGHRGPWWWRLILGRLGRMAGRRSALRRLRQHPHAQDRERRRLRPRGAWRPLRSGSSGRQPA